MTRLQRTCGRCGTTKEGGAFAAHKNGRHGLDSTCRDCKNRRRRELRRSRLGDAFGRRKTTKIEIGKTYFHLTAIEFVGRDRWGRAKYRFACDCGAERIAWARGVISGATKHCGCRRGANLIKADFASAVTRIYLRYKHNATARDLVFLLSKEDVSGLIRKACFYCGAPFSSETGPKGARLRHNGIDRADNTLGYTLDNSVPCCGPCNRAKQTASSDEFIALAIRIARHQGVTK